MPDGPPAPAAPPLIEARHVSKAFPGIQALDGVSLSLARGEVLCVVGENGAGKSTLMKILGGVYTADAGEVRLDGRLVRLANVHEAQAAGIALIHQELNLAQSLDVAGNIFLGREPVRAGPLRLLDRRMYDAAEAITRRVGLAVSPHRAVASLSIGQQQLVEIARALAMSARAIIMDEPTSSLTARDTERLFAVIRDLKRSGVGVLYISHRLQEVQEIADRVTVLRDGRNAGELAREQITHAALVRLMIGRELKQFFIRSHRPKLLSAGTVAPPAADTALAVEGFRVTPAQRRPIDFQVGRGEIVGLAGLVGAGRTELAEALYGIRQPLAGTIRVDGRAVSIRRPADAIAAGLLLVPEDRRVQGLFLADTIRRNISLASLIGRVGRTQLPRSEAPRLSPSEPNAPASEPPGSSRRSSGAATESLSHLRLVNLRRERGLAERMCRQLAIRTSGVEKLVGLLSGGNQQKVVLARWLCRQPRLLMLDEPTRGVDVGAKAEIYALVDQLTAGGVGILMISSDLEEILGMSDRVLVMHQGELAGELQREQLSEEAVMHLATGGERRETV